MPLPIPALAQLRCFEAAARHGSFTLAADELCLTPSAVSHQLRALEVALGVDLFARIGRKMALTEAGRRYLEDIRPAFEQIGAATRRLRLADREVLTVGVAPSFAEACLMPNLVRFLRANPQIEIRILTYDHQPDAGLRDLDCEIRYGHGKWPGAAVEKLADDALLPLCSPETLALHGPLDGPEALAWHTLIHTESRHFGWDRWFQRRGLPLPRGRRLRVDRSPLAIRAAADGLGIALESRLLATREVSDGSLVPVPGVGAGQERLDESYFLVRPRLHRPPARVAAFAEWLRRDLSAVIKGALAQASPMPRARRGEPSRAISRTSSRGLHQATGDGASESFSGGR